MKVVHIADVHWRGLKRHDEYRAVFEQLFKEARAEKPDRIVVAGDIVHSKTQGITPELIQHLVWWFTEMASIAPTIVTLGNHDGLILNKSRLDAISPIIEALCNPNIIFLRDSKVHTETVRGLEIAWCNFSCFDEEGWDDVKPVPGHINIALFHGAVWGAKTDSEWELTEGEVDIHKFSNFDYGMFGDIHKYQLLDQAGRFAYPGSTIQQNFGEDIDKGYLVWDIESREKWTISRRIVQSPHPHVTVQWAGSVQATIEACRSHRPGSRFRISSNSDLLQEEFKQLAHFLKDEQHATEITWKIDSKKETGTISLDADLIEKESLRDQKTQLTLLRQYIKEDGFDDDEWKIVEKLIEKNLAHVNEEESPRHAKWSIKRMEWENTFTYGKDNLIDFTKLNGVVGLFGPNRSGKSSIPGTIMYGLYNTTDRGSIKNLHIVNARKGHCNVTIDFSLNSKTYRVERMTTKSTSKKGITGAATHVNLWQLDPEGNPILDMSGEQRRDSDKVLRGLIGSAEDFLLTSFASQGEMNNFIKEKASARKMYLSSFLDLGVFDEVFRKLKDDSYGLKGAMKSPRVDYEKSITDSKGELHDLESRKETLTAETKESRERVHDLNVVLATHKDKGNVTQADIDEAERRLRGLFEKRVESKQKLTDSIDTREKSQLKLEKIEGLKSKFPLQSLRDELTQLRELERRESSFDSSLEKERMVLKNQEKSVSKLAEVPCGDSFPSCKFIKDSHRDKKLIDQQKQVIADLQEEIRSVAQQVKAIREKSLEEKLRKYDDVLREEATLRVKLKSCVSEESLLEESISTLDAKINNLEPEIASMRLRAVDSESSAELDALKKKVYEAQESIRAKEGELSGVDRNCGILLGRIENLIAEQESFVKARKEWRLYEKLLGAYGKNGIPLMILATELPKINAEISKILHGVTGFTVVLEADPDSNDLEVYLDYGDSQRPVELGSGMEKMMASLAIRVALINISSLPKTDILVIDEGFGALDDANVEACNRLLSSLKRYFKTILVISHVDGVKEAVDGMIEIGKNGKDSHVQYV